MLITAGDDPAVVEADLDIPAVNVLTVHKAKGLEFTVVFLVGLVMGRFPWPRRRDPIELPEELIKDILPSGDFHIQEERRLFYVGMTRAKKELYLTAASNYGGTRPRKVSQFVLEALDLPKTEAKVIKTVPLEAIKRYTPKVKQDLGKRRIIPETEPITLSYFHIDDYLSCPLKYKYFHILRIPILRHHTVIYGKAIHDAIQYYHQCKVNKKPVNEEDLVSVFQSSWVSEGFLSWEHEEQRFEAGKAALRRFFREQEKKAKLPTYVENKFSFTLDRDRIVGRWDRIDIEDDKVTIIDFKSSEVFRQKDADRRVRESLQLSIYALAYQKVFGRIPDRVELHFLESGLVGVSERTESDLEKVVKKIKEVSQGIRRHNFDPAPQYLACRYCAYRDICHHAKIQV
jgi:DNA helicase-2/ATP-dependent DNA helicase PcrA